MKKFFNLVALTAMILSLTVTNINKVSAEQMTVTAFGEYVMDSRVGETTEAATAMAREQAKRAAAEKAGVYVEAYSKSVDFELTEDEIQTVTAQLLQIQSEDCEVSVVEKNLLKFKVTITAIVESTSEAELKALLSSRENISESTRRYNELQQEYDKLKTEMENLRNRYENANAQQRETIRNEVARNNNNFKALEALEEGNRFYFRKDYSSALNSYGRAIQINPHLVEAYNNRGAAYQELNQHAQAIQDYSSALQLNPNFGYAYNNRGNAYAMTGQLQQAAQDLNSALRLLGDKAEIHNNLGGVYLSMKNFNDAIGEYTKAININPNYADAYYNRAVTYYAKGEYSKALRDANRALELNPNDSATRDLQDDLMHKSGR